MAHKTIALTTELRERPRLNGDRRSERFLRNLSPEREREREGERERERESERERARDREREGT